MNKKEQLAKNTAIILLGKISTQFISFILLPLYTAELLASEFGIVDLVMTYIGLLVPVVTLQLESSLFRYLIDVRGIKVEEKKIITNVFSAAIIQTTSCIALFLFISRFIDINYLGYLCSLIFASVISNLLLQMLRGLGDTALYSISSVITGVSIILFNILLIKVIPLGANGMFLSSILGNLGCSLFIILKKRALKYIDLSYLSKKTIINLLKYSIPLVPNGIIWWIINVSDRTLITLFLGVSSNGIYAIANKFPHVFISIYNIFNTSWTESASLHINSSDRDEFFNSTIISMFKLFSSMCLGIIAVLPLIFPIMINIQYSDAYLYIPILMLSTLFNIIVGLISVVYVAKKLTKEIVKTSFWSGLINILLNIVMINYIGVYAAAFSTLISFMFMAIYRYFHVQKYIKLKFGKKLITQTILMFSLTIYFYYKNNFILNLMNILFVIIYSIITNKEFIYILLVKYLKKFIPTDLSQYFRYKRVNLK